MPRDTTELEAMLLALNRSAERLQALWLSFIGLSIYFILTSLTTTHRMLLLEEHQTLPLVNLKVPLLPFYVIAPLFYIAIHFYMLLMLVLLARSAAAFEAMLRDALPIDSDRERFRMRLENTLFLQLLSGARSERKGINGLFLAALALITTAMTPCATLLVMQLQFLPYHSVGVTWLHRAAVLIDLLLIWFLWRGYRHRWGRTLPRSPWSLWRQRGPRWWLQGPLFLTGRFLTLFAVFWMCLVEGRWAGEPLIDPTGGRDARILRLVGVDLPASPAFTRLEKLKKSLEQGGGAAYNPFKFLLDDTISNDITEPEHFTFDYRIYSKIFKDGLRPVFWSGLFSDRLSLRHEIVTGAARLDDIKRETLSTKVTDLFIPSWSFKGRDFTAADFSGADLRGVDLSNTILRGATLTEALLDGAQFVGTDMFGAYLDKAHANGALFEKVDLTDSNLSNSKFNGAHFFESEMECADFDGADLVGTIFSSNRLSVASFDGTNLGGATFHNVLMPLTSFRGSRLDGAWFGNSQLSGASFLSVTARAARMTSISAYAFQGDDNFNKGFDGKDLSLSGLNISKTALLITKEPFLWDSGQFPFRLGPRALAEFDGIELTKPDVANEDYTKAVETWLSGANSNLKNSECINPWSYPEHIVFLKLQEDKIGDAISILDEFSDLGKFWTTLEAETKAKGPDGKKYRAALAQVLGDLACRSGEGAPFVARALVKDRFHELSEHLDSVRDRLKAGRAAPAACTGVASFSEADWQVLDNIVADEVNPRFKVYPDFLPKDQWPH